MNGDSQMILGENLVFTKKRKCLLAGYDKSADSFCKDYACKIEDD